jgi:putative hydrolase of the HAD superfamily
MNKIPIYALILDYGGVISQPQNPENVNNLCQHLQQTGNDFQKVYRSQRAPYDSGQLSGQQYWRNVLQSFGLALNDFDIAYLVQEDIKSWTQLNQAMVQFIAASRSKFHKLAMISNMTSDTLAFMRSHYPWLALFDELCFSCELGTNKPDPAIYEICLSKLGLLPNECLFVDDSLENVEGALKLGIHAIQFKTFPEFILELNEKYRFTN